MRFAGNRRLFAIRYSLFATTTRLKQVRRSNSPLVNPLPLFVGVRFQVSFTPLAGVLFTFPSRYWFAIGHTRVLRLGGWSPHLQTGFHVSRLTRGPSSFLPVRGYHPLWPAFPSRSGSYSKATGLIRVRSPLLTES